MADPTLSDISAALMSNTKQAGGRGSWVDTLLPPLIDAASISAPAFMNANRARHLGRYVNEWKEADQLAHRAMTPPGIPGVMNLPGAAPSPSYTSILGNLKDYEQGWPGAEHRFSPKNTSPGTALGFGAASAGAAVAPTAIDYLNDPKSVSTKDWVDALVRGGVHGGIGVGGAVAGGGIRPFNQRARAGLEDLKVIKPLPKEDTYFGNSEQLTPPTGGPAPPVRDRSKAFQSYKDNLSKHGILNPNAWDPAELAEYLKKRMDRQ